MGSGLGKGSGEAALVVREQTQSPAYAPVFHPVNPLPPSQGLILLSG